MEAKKLFTQAASQANGLMRHVNESHFGNQTPCTDWDTRALLNHMVYETLWVPDIVAGKTVKEVGNKYEGDVLGSDCQKSWAAAYTRASEAVQQADPKAIAHLSYGDVPLEEYLREIATDILIHTWDLGQSIWVSVLMEPETVKSVYDTSLPRKDTYAASGLFAPPVDVPKDAPLSTKLLAIFGRTVPKVV